MVHHRLSLSEFLEALPDPDKASNQLNLISFNIQVGIQTAAYHHYLTRSWQHLLPHKRRTATLDRIAEILRHFDIAALQEADGGSWRSNFINQVEHIAKKAEFPHWFQQTNRNIKPIAKHSNGLLSRLEPYQVEYHKLPGLLPGRGAMVMKIGRQEPLFIIVLHLALGSKTQAAQLGYIQNLIAEAKHVVIMGDLNNHADHLLTNTPLAKLNFHSVDPLLHTFPSWQPQRGLDHILVSEGLKINQVAVLDTPISDHLPIAMQIQLPKKIIL
jgi:endonuclease/exonuclease/phosphatase family metal-dependent hydrolase